MLVVVTWDEHTTQQAEIDVPDDMPSCEITDLAEARAREGSGALVSKAEPGVISWTAEETPDGQPRVFGGRFR